MKPKLIRYSWDHDQNQMVLDPEGGWVLYEPVASRIEELEWEAKCGSNLRDVLDEWLTGNKPWSRDIDWLDAWWYGDPVTMKEAADRIKALEQELAEARDPVIRSLNGDSDAEREKYYSRGRREALEEVASSRFLRPLIEEQSEGEWDDKTIDRDVATFAKAIRALMEKKND